jgi:hypothetical protein
VPILPFRIEDVAPSKSLDYFIGSVHWLDAMTPPLEQHLDDLVVTVQKLLTALPGTQAGPRPTAAARSSVNRENAPDAPGLSQWQRFANTFAAPAKTFADIKRGNKSWWMPFVIMALVSYIFFAAVFVKIGMRKVVDNQIKLDPKTEERLAQVPADQREKQMTISVYITEGVFIAQPAFMLAGVALMSLGLWGTINFVFGGKATFGSTFAVWMYASLPSIVKALLGTVVIFAGAEPDTFNIKNFAPTNIGAFMNPLEYDTTLYKTLYELATWLDATTIWMLVLLGMGTAIVAGVKRTSGFIAVFGWWVFFLLISVGLTAFRG